jgi:hypothetical protein
MQGLAEARENSAYREDGETIFSLRQEVNGFSAIV